jgi:thymidylate synthase (FAD)
MSVKLISYSKSALNGINNLQELVAYCARVSNPSNQFNNQSSEKLIKYLIKNKHWSPLEMVNVCLEITTTRDIARQILRHRSFSFQELSQRYANPFDSLSFVKRDARLQDYKNRQNSIDTDNKTLHEKWEQIQNDIIGLSRESYDWAIKNDIAKEQARVLLPEGLIESRMYVNGTVRSWVHYVSLRNGNGTQKEHMEIARKCSSEISSVFPLFERLL